MPSGHNQIWIKKQKLSSYANSICWQMGYLWSSKILVICVSMNHNFYVQTHAASIPPLIYIYKTCAFALLRISWQDCWCAFVKVDVWGFLYLYIFFCLDSRNRPNNLDQRRIVNVGYRNTTNRKIVWHDTNNVCDQDLLQEY